MTMTIERRRGWMEGRPRKTGRRQASAANGAMLKVDQRVRTVQMIEANKKV